MRSGWDGLFLITGVLLIYSTYSTKFPVLWSLYILKVKLHAIVWDYV